MDVHREKMIWAYMYEREGVCQNTDALWDNEKRPEGGVNFSEGCHIEEGSLNVQKYRVDMYVQR